MSASGAYDVEMRMRTLPWFQGPDGAIVRPLALRRRLDALGTSEDRGERFVKEAVKIIERFVEEDRRHGKSCEITRGRGCEAAFELVV